MSEVMVEPVAVQFSDVEDTRQVLKACLNYFTAIDVQEAQLGFTSLRKSPLSAEVERVTQKLSSYLGDYLRERYESGLLEEDDPEDIYDLDDTPVVDEELEPLSGSPLGGVDLPRQTGRLVTTEELREREALEAE